MDDSEYQRALDLAERHMNEKHACLADNKRLRATLRVVREYADLCAEREAPLAPQVVEALDAALAAAS